MGFLRRQRRDLDVWLTERGKAHTFSLTAYGVYMRAAALIDEHGKGVVLDAGSGRAPYKKMLRERGVQLLTIDIDNRSGDVTHIADIQEMQVIATASIDTVICTNVLEHVPRPWRAVEELHRVLKPSGTLILSVPHISPIHEAPHDYFRYTRYGVTSLLESGGFRVVTVDEVGGLLALLGHATSMVFLSTFGALPGLRAAAWAVNYAVLVRGLGMLDEASGLTHVYPCNQVVLAVKRPEGAEGSSTAR